LAQLHAEQPGPKHTRKSANNVAAKRSLNKEQNVAAQAYLARQTLMALRNILSLGALHGHSHADVNIYVNLAYADLKELELAAQDILLHRSDRHELPLFKELRLFSSQGTCTFSPAFTSWRRRFEQWQLDSDRKYGICRVPTDTDFLREEMEGDLTQPIEPHPFYSCPLTVGQARNVWVLPAAPAWWHDALWKLGPGPGDGDDQADLLQGDLRWRLYRAAGELKSITGCSLKLVPPPILALPPDFVNGKIRLSQYIQILGTPTFDVFAQCHCTQELLRMQWEWEEIPQLPALSPHQRYGNWETADGRYFRCQWVDTCPPCAEALRGTLLCHLDGDHVDYDFQDFCDDDYG
jgi:hypothetical protein